MKVLLNSILIVAGAGLGLLVGFALHGKALSKTSEQKMIAGSAPVTLASRTNSLVSRTVVRAPDDSPLATKLARDLSMSSGVTRWLYWLEALEQAGPADFPRLLKLAQGNAAATRLVEARWIEVAPRHLFDAVVAGSKMGDGLLAEPARALFREWPRRDPDAAIAALNEAASDVRHHWGFSVAYSLMENDMERGLKLLSEWHVDEVGFGPSGLATITKWTQADPRHAAEFMLERPDTYSFRSTIETIGKEWARTDPAGALAFATSKPGELASMLATSVLKEWAESDLNQAADWLSGADPRKRNRLGPTFVEAWAKQDAPNALAWCEENLDGSTLPQSVAGVLRGAAEKEVAQAAALVAEMTPSQARSEGAVVVAQKWFPTLSSGQRVAPETLAWLANLDADSVKRVLDQVSWGWATSDPKSMAAFLASVSSEPISSHTYTVAARELARNNPAEALQWASHLPEQPAITAGSAAFTEWRNSQPEAAMKWLGDLPAEDARHQPFFESAIRALAYHPQAAEQLAAMTPEDRATARSVIATMSLPADRRARLLDVLGRH